MIEFYINYTIVVLLIEEFFSRFCHILTAFEFIRVYIYIYILDCRFSRIPASFAEAERLLRFESSTDTKVTKR